MFDYCNFGLFEVNSAKIKKQPPRYKGTKKRKSSHREKIKIKKEKAKRWIPAFTGTTKRSGNNEKKSLDYKKKRDGR